jgi:hypothetical protein
MIVNKLLCFQVSFEPKVGYFGLRVWSILIRANPHFFVRKSFSNLQNARFILHLKEIFLCV